MCYSECVTLVVNALFLEQCTKTRQLNPKNSQGIITNCSLYNGMS